MCFTEGQECGENNVQIGKEGKCMHFADLTSGSVRHKYF